MPRSPWPYFGAAALLLGLAIASQFELRLASLRREPVEHLLQLRHRDLNVVFLLIDTLRADRLGAYGYERETSPTLDALARTGILFEDVTSQSSWTKTSMASLWTGTYPASNGILRFDDVLPEQAVMPAERFREEGYRTVGLWRNEWVEPSFGFGQGFEIYVRPAPGAERIRRQRQDRPENPVVGTDEDITRAALDFLDRFGDERFFLYLHYMDVHQYVYDEAAAIFGTRYSDIYDQAVRHTDRLLGVLVQALEDAGVLGRTLVVIASDHGEAFLEHGSEGHGRNLYGEVTRVPLLFLPPFLLDPGVRVSQPVSNADIWPTILDLVGLPPLPGADGRSAVPLILASAGAAGDGRVRIDRDRPLFAQLALGWGIPKAPSRQLVSVTRGGERLFATLESDARTELYDLEADPGEKDNLAAERPEEVAALRELIDRYAREAAPPWQTPPGTLDLDALRLGQLRALGYTVRP